MGLNFSGNIDGVSVSQYLEYQMIVYNDNVQWSEFFWKYRLRSLQLYKLC